MHKFTIKPISKWLGAIVTASMIAGCSVDIEIEDDKPDPNLTLTQLSVEENVIYKATDTMVIDYDLVVEDLYTPDVIVEFHLVHASDDAENEEEVEIDDTHLLASITHESVDNGDHFHSVEVEVPIVDNYGEYWVVAIVDPNDDVTEDNEDDNHPNLDNENHVNGEFPSARITIDPHDQHDFLISDLEVDGGAAIIDTPSSHEGTGDHHSDLIGYLDVVYRGEAVEVPLVGIQAQVEIDGVYENVSLWDAEVGEHVMQLDINIDYTNEDDAGEVFDYNGQDHFVGFDIEMSDEQRQALYDNYDADSDNELNVRFILIDETEHPEEEINLDNNVYDITLPLFFFDADETADDASGEVSSASEVSAAGYSFTGNQMAVDGSFGAYYGDASKFKVGATLEGSLVIDLLDRGGVLESGGRVDMWIFNAYNEIFGVEFNAQAYLTGVNSGYDASITIFNTKVYEDELYVAQFEKTFEKSWEEERVLASAKFFVGPVPISVEAGINGGIGFELTVGYASKIYVEGDVFTTNLGGFANGGIDLILISGGVTVQITIIDNTLRLDSEANLALLDEGALDPRIEYSFAVTDSLDVISGKFGLYASVKSIKWCKKWFIPYPCGSKTNTYYLWLYQTPSLYDKTWTIYSKEDSFSI